MVPARPASAAESAARPRGPLPTGATSSTPAAPLTRPASGSERKGGSGGEDTSGKGTTGKETAGEEAVGKTAAFSGADKGPAVAGAKGAAAGGAQDAKGSEGTEAAKGAGAKGTEAAKDAEGGERAGGESGKETPAKERAATVKVISGTRRYHGTDCPLIRGAGDSGVETMTLAQAETAGLTSCSVCQSDRETAG